MIEKHKARLRVLADDDVSVVAGLFRVGADEPYLIDALECRNASLADVVIALVRAGERRLAASFCPIKTGPPPVITPKPYPQIRRVASYVARMYPDLRLPRADQTALRVRLGMTLEQIITSGVAVSAIMAERRAGRLAFSTEPRT